MSQSSLCWQRAVFNATYSRLCRRPHAFKMPIQVSLRLFDSEEEQTIELPDNATGLTVKEWVRDTCGLEVQKQQAVVFPGGTKVLNDGDLLSSDSQFLRIKIGYVGGGASAAAAAAAAAVDVKTTKTSFYSGGFGGN